jgi:hypothetical protein
MALFKGFLQLVQLVSGKSSPVAAGFLLEVIVVCVMKIVCQFICKYIGDEKYLKTNQ